MRSWLLLPKQWSNYLIVITILEVKAMRQKITTGAIPLVYSNFNRDPL
jgi:hypothetical protein